MSTTNTTDGAKVKASSKWRHLAGILHVGKAAVGWSLVLLLAVFDDAR